MVFLILAILCGSLFSIIFKLCQRHDVDGRQVTLFNYAVAFLFTLLPIVARTVFDPGTSASDYIPGASSWLLAVVQGLLFTFGFIVMDRSTQRSGVALTTVCARASLILPVLLSWILLSQPAPSWLPVILVVAAMALIIGPTETRPAGRAATGGPGRHAIMFALLGVFLVFGCSDFFLKVVQHTVDKGHSGNPVLIERQLSALTCIIFLMASVASLVVCAVSGSFRKHRVKWSTVGWGALLGFANIGCTSCMLRALAAMPTGLFYPLYNIGIVIVATLVGLLFFGERLKWVQVGGLVLAIAAIALSF
jgi:drug/metabolite transporter (DMT)-like permease